MAETDTTTKTVDIQCKGFTVATGYESHKDEDGKTVRTPVRTHFECESNTTYKTKMKENGKPAKPYCPRCSFRRNTMNRVNDILEKIELLKNLTSKQYDKTQTDLENVVTVLSDAVASLDSVYKEIQTTKAKFVC